MCKRVCIKTNCCAVQRNETYRISEFFRVNGWFETDKESVADIIVITTCGVTENTEDEAFELINSAVEKMKPDSRIIVSGCLPNICNNKLIDKFPQIECISLENITDFDFLIDATISISDVSYNSDAKQHHSEGDPRLDVSKYDDELEFAKSLSLMNNHEGFLDAFNYATQGRYLWKDQSIYEIKISSGCNQNCSYCASRLGIGRYRSKDILRIMKELEEGVSLGYKKIMLMGDELGSYGIDTGSSLVQLVKRMLDSYDSIKIGIRYIYPTFFHSFIVEMAPYLDRLFFICVSIQSASSNVLSKMNREDITPLIEADIVNLRKEHANIFIHTQIMIGFPNETNEDFYKTVSFLKKCRFDYIRYNIYSPRNNTVAYNMDMCYSEADLNVRKQAIKEFCQQNRKAVIYDRYIGIFKSLKAGSNDVSIS